MEYSLTGGDAKNPGFMGAWDTGDSPRGRGAMQFLREKKRRFFSHFHLRPRGYVFTGGGMMTVYFHLWWSKGVPRKTLETTQNGEERDPG